jgi:hypothetical protein
MSKSKQYKLGKKLERKRMNVSSGAKLYKGSLDLKRFGRRRFF